MTFHLIFVHIIFSSVKVADWPPFGKELLLRLTICSLCTLPICNFSHFHFWLCVQDLGSDSSSFWSLRTCYFNNLCMLKFRPDKTTDNRRVNCTTASKIILKS